MIDTREMTNQQLQNELANAHAQINELKNTLLTQPPDENKFLSVIDASPVPYALNDEQQNIVYLNPAFINTFGYDLSDIPTLDDWWPKAYPDSQYRQWVLDVWQQHLDTARQANRPFESLEVNVCCKDNSSKTIVVGASFLTGVFAGIHLVTLYDVTESRQAEIKLNQAVTLLENVINSTSDLIFVKNEKLQTILCNHAFAQAVGKECEEMYGNTDIENGWDPELVKGSPEKNNRGYLQDDLDVLSGLDIHNPFDQADVCGEVRIFDTHKQPLKDAAGNITGVIGISRDITERKHTEEQLQRSQKMDALGQLTGGIAHDFNNVLGVILGYTELLQEKLAHDPQLSRYAEQINSAGNRAKTLTSKLLSFARKQPSEKKPCDINSLLQQNQLMLEKTLTARIELVIEHEKHLWNVCIDEAMLVDAIVNMCFNSMHAIAESGKLTISTQNCLLKEDNDLRLSIPAGDYVRLSLTDTGTGISSEIKNKIFEPFFTTRGAEGTGLGLSQVYGFVQQSKGEIQVISEADRGTQIIIYIPRYNEQLDGECCLTNNSVFPATIKNETILVVDDEPALRELVKEILSMHNYQVECAQDSAEALKILATKNIKLMLADVIMPGMNGYQLASRVSEEYPQVKILIASGYNEQQSQDGRSYQQLHKPYHSSTLLKSIRGLLDHKH